MARELTLQQLLDAIEAMGGAFIIDPEHGPDALGGEHRADLLGFLAATVAAFTAAATDPHNANEGPAWTHGYLAACESTDTALTALGGALRAEASITAAVHPHTAFTTMATRTIALAADLTLFAAAVNSDHPEVGITADHWKGLKARVRRQLTDIRATMSAVERELRDKGYQL